MTVKELKIALEGKPDDYEIFFRRVVPICGNIEAAGKVIQSTYQTFGIVVPCLIVEPYTDEEVETAQ
jgi:hypothetical protein